MTLFSKTKLSLCARYQATSASMGIKMQTIGHTSITYSFCLKKTTLCSNFSLIQSIPYQINNLKDLLNKTKQYNKTMRKCSLTLILWYEFIDKLNSLRFISTLRGLCIIENYWQLYWVLHISVSFFFFFFFF